MFAQEGEVHCRRGFSVGAGPTPRPLVAVTLMVLTLSGMALATGEGGLRCAAQNWRLSPNAIYFGFL